MSLHSYSTVLSVLSPSAVQVVHAYMWCDMVVLNAMSGLRFALFENLLGMYCYMLQNVDLC